ncbi:MAG: glycosyltransferase [Candidatus Riflebacteria bacterium]|nr:glycosyltransferase [Candidatus Riflebacteria bacterium]
MTTRLISVILPVHDQADHIARIVVEHEEALARLQYPHEMLLVVNGCRDRSLDECQALQARFPTIRVVASERGGWGLAVRIGLGEARGDLICYTNSARTSTKELMLFLLYATVHPGVVIKANRKIRESWRRRLGSLLFNLQCRFLFDLPCWDINGTHKVFPRSFHKLLELSREDNLIDAEFNVVCRREGYPMIEVPVISVRRHGGESTTGYRAAVGMYFGAFQLWRQLGAWEEPNG